MELVSTALVGDHFFVALIKSGSSLDMVFVHMVKCAVQGMCAWKPGKASSKAGWGLIMLTIFKKLLPSSRPVRSVASSY